MSPSIYLQYLHVKARNPKLFEDDTIRIAHTVDFNSSQQHIVKDEPNSPLPMSQKDINYVLTTAAASPSSPILGYAQPIETSPVFGDQLFLLWTKEPYNF